MNHLWIGLKDEGHPNYYEKWSDADETPVTFVRWDRNRPKMVTGDKVQCVLAYRASFLWANNGCDRKTNYICERPKQKTNHIDTEDEGCKAGWQAYGNRCYKFVQQRKLNEGLFRGIKIFVKSKFLFSKDLFLGTVILSRIATW